MWVFVNYSSFFGLLETQMSLLFGVSTIPKLLRDDRRKWLGVSNWGTNTWGWLKLVLSSFCPNYVIEYSLTSYPLIVTCERRRIGIWSERVCTISFYVSIHFRYLFAPFQLAYVKKSVARFIAAEVIVFGGAFLGFCLLRRSERTREFLYHHTPAVADLYYWVCFFFSVSSLRNKTLN